MLKRSIWRRLVFGRSTWRRSTSRRSTSRRSTYNSFEFIRKLLLVFKTLFKLSLLIRDHNLQSLLPQPQSKILTRRQDDITIVTRSNKTNSAKVSLEDGKDKEEQDVELGHTWRIWMRINLSASHCLIDPSLLQLKKRWVSGTKWTFVTSSSCARSLLMMWEFSGRISIQVQTCVCCRSRVPRWLHSDL